MDFCEGPDPSTLGLDRDNGRENGNYSIIIGYVLGLYKDNVASIVRRKSSGRSATMFFCIPLRFLLNP